MPFGPIQKTTNHQTAVSLVYLSKSSASQGSKGASEYQYIPQEKIEEFGVHASAYYPLEISIFKSSSDDALLSLLWNKYWANTLSSSPLISVRFLEAYSNGSQFTFKSESSICGIAIK